MSFQIVCYLCKSFAQKSCSYNIQLGYDTKFVCSIECHIALKAYIDAQYKYNNAKIGNMLIYAYDKHNYLWTKRPLTRDLIHTLLKRAVEHYSTSTSCRLLSYISINHKFFGSRSTIPQFNWGGKLLIRIRNLINAGKSFLVINGHKKIHLIPSITQMIFLK